MAKRKPSRRSPLPRAPRCEHCMSSARVSPCCAPLPVERLDQKRVEAILNGGTLTTTEARLLAREVSQKRLTHSPAFSAFLGWLGEGLGKGLVAAGAASTSPQPTREVTEADKYERVVKMYPDARVVAGGSPLGVKQWACRDVPTLRLLVVAILAGQSIPSPFRRTYTWKILSTGDCTPVASGQVEVP